MSAPPRRQRLPFWPLALALPLLLGGAAQGADSSAATLRARHASLRTALESSPFKRPIVLSSAEAPGKLRGDVDAVIDQPFARVSQALAQPETWCEVLVLQPNVRLCRVKGSGPVRQLEVHVGKSFDQPIEDAKLLTFEHRVVSSGADLLEVALTAKEGPLGTRDYDIALDVAPLDGRSFMHFAYSYGYGTLARIAMQAYLATSGRDKVGFSTDGRGPDGEPNHIGGVRGAVERNTMRYQLAIEAVLASLQLPPADQPEARLRHYLAAIAAHPRQLQEDNPVAYRAAKQRDLKRQASAAGRN